MEEFSGITMLSAIISSYSFLFKFFLSGENIRKNSLNLAHKFVLCTWHIAKESAKKRGERKRKKEGEDRYRIASFGMLNKGLDNMELIT